MTKVVNKQFSFNKECVMVYDPQKAILFHPGEFQADCPFTMLKVIGENIWNACVKLFWDAITIVEMGETI